MSVPWYARWFGDEYLRLYPHRDEAEADRAVDLFLARCGLDPEARVLDLGCGAGRHLRALGAKGALGIGLDLSLPLLQAARERNAEERVVRSDMRRLPFQDAVFAAVTSFFTSFGYFSSDEDDARVLFEVRRTLTRHGCFLLDFLNAGLVRRTLSPRDEEERDGHRIVQERRLVDGGRAVEKTIRLTDAETLRESVFHERVRLYDRDELTALLGRHGLEPEFFFGDYEGGPPMDDAPRVIVISRAR